jgi:putative transcriptional regulator
VELDALIALARLTGPAEEAWSPVVGDLGSVDLAHDPALVADRVERLRVFRGYSGWGPMQLDDELAEGAWMVLPAENEDVFVQEPDDLWRAVLRRQGGRIAWVANAPDDLSSN